MTDSISASGSAPSGRCGMGDGIPEAKRACRRQIRWSGLATAALVTALLAGVSAPAVAASPELNVPWLGDGDTGCTLDSTTVANLTNRLTASGIENGTTPDRQPEIAFVVVYSLAHDNDGQPVTVRGTAGYTGAVLCLNTDVAGRASTTQTSGIPEGGGTADFKDLEDAFIIRYQLNNADSTTEKVFCHSAKSSVGCVRVSPDLP